MHDSVQDFIERMGLLLESEGLPRIAGRIFGFLLVHEGAFSLDELAGELQVSKASVSTNARHLEQHGFLERVSSPGDRRDYYRMREDAWRFMLREAQRKWRTLQALFQEAAAVMPDELAAGRRRLEEAERFQRMMLARAKEMLEEWERGAGSGVAAGGGEPEEEL